MRCMQQATLVDYGEVLPARGHTDDHSRASIADLEARPPNDARHEGLLEQISRRTGTADQEAQPDRGILVWLRAAVSDTLLRRVTAYADLRPAGTGTDRKSGGGTRPAVT